MLQLLTFKRTVPFHFLLGVGATDSVPAVAVRCTRFFRETIVAVFEEHFGGRPQRVRV